MLFEFVDNEEPLESLELRRKFENFLKEIWANRYFAYSQEIQEDDAAGNFLNYSKQPFLIFDGVNYRTQNYVGFIQYDKQLIEIYPKVFKQSGIHKDEVLRHIFYWFSYCKKLNFPVLENSLDNLNVNDIPELLIWNFADYCFNTISTQPFRQYETVEEPLNTPKGRINFPAYIKNGLSTGNYQNIDCIYEPFLYDNRLNRAIKYVCRLLLNMAKLAETRNKIEEIIFVLDEVEDEPCNVVELDKIVFNRMYEEYAPIKEWCKRVIEQQLYSSSNYNSFQWSLLLPMEYVFEDFIYGFIKRHFNNHFLEIKDQKSNYYLAKGNGEDIFQLRHDILLRRKLENGSDETIIIDTKYKVRSIEDLKDKKRGIASSDMYQMVSYAYRRGCKKVILLYPSGVSSTNQGDEYEIKTDFPNMPEIKIYAYEIPFWDVDSYKNIESRLNKELSRILGID